MGWSPKCCCLRRAYPLELVLDSTAWISWDLPRLGEGNKKHFHKSVGSKWAWGTGTASYRACKSRFAWERQLLIYGKLHAVDWHPVSLEQLLGGVYDVGSIRADAGREFQWGCFGKVWGETEEVGMDETGTRLQRLGFQMEILYFKFRSCNILISTSRVHVMNSEHALSNVKSC